MMAERIKDGFIDAKENEMIEKIVGELIDVIEDFMRAVDVESLFSAKKSGKRSSPPCDSLFS